MECRDVREVADSFLAGELLTETSHQILRHLDTCRPCRVELAGRRALRDGIRRALEEAPEFTPRPEFVAELRTKLQAAAAQAPVRRGIKLQKWWTLAAVLVLAATIMFAFRSRQWFTGADTLAVAAVGDHRYCALHYQLNERPISLEMAAEKYDAAYRVLETLPPVDVSTASGPARVLERHVCVYDGRRFGHLVLAYRGTRISLIMTEAPGDAGAASGGLPQVKADGRVDGMTVVSFRAARHRVFLTGDLPHVELVSLADVVAGPLYRRLTGV